MEIPETALMRWSPGVIAVQGDPRTLTEPTKAGVWVDLLERHARYIESIPAADVVLGWYEYEAPDGTHYTIVIVMWPQRDGHLEMLVCLDTEWDAITDGQFPLTLASGGRLTAEVTMRIARMLQEKTAPD